jgi:hypothetical protein
VGYLGERLRPVKGFNIYNQVKTAEIYLVPNVMVPKRLKVSEFFKYMGL